VPDLRHEGLARQYELDLERVNLRYVEPLATVWPYSSEGGRYSGDPFEAHRALTGPYDLFVNVVVAPPIRSYARRSALLVLFPFVGRGDVWPWKEPDGGPPLPKRVLRNAYYGFRWRQVFSSYQRYVANSKFTAGWVHRRWGRRAEVVYPPVRARFTPRPKAKRILSLGRFSRVGTQKKQLEMVRTFAEAHERHLEGWEYLCVGGVSDNPRDLEYVEDVRKAGKDAPVRVMANVPDSEVKDAYETSAVFWHGAGYGEDEDIHPELTEHFGMSTVEAMAAGCVPVAIRKGGQPEIVEHGVSGFLWDEMEDLVSHTERLVSSLELRKGMAEAALERARAFTDMEAFATRMRRILGA
jgi:glycosyltransferase involved in cell wall biosynthesis